MKINKVSNYHSKWKKAKLLAGHSVFRRYAPPTALLSRRSLESYLNRYSAIYVKPNRGRHGAGVMKTAKFTRDRKTIYTYHLDMVRKQFSSFNSLYEMVRKHSGWDTFLVQKGIRSLTYHGRPFDIRVMVQKNPQGQWETTGKIGRVAHPKKIVTNYNLGRNGGTPMPLDTIFRALISSEKKQQVYTRLDRMGREMAKYLQRTTYPRLKAVGLDVMIDHSLKPWIIEVNTESPNPYLFRHVRNKRIFGKILRYHRFNHRTNSRK